MRSSANKTILVLCVLLFMLCAGIVLYIVQGMNGGRGSYTTPSFAEFSAKYTPSFSDILDITQSSFGAQELLSQQYSITSLDGQTITVYVSKPKGNGPFPVALLLHDSPSSTKTTRDISRSVGEVIAQQHQAMVVAIDHRDVTQADTTTLDLATTIDWLRQFSQADVKQLRFIGVGRGGHTVARFLQTTQLPEDVRGAFLLNAYADPSAVWNYQRENDEKESVFFVQYFGCSTQTTAQGTPQECLAKFVLSSAPIKVPVTIATTQDNQRIPESESSAVESRVENPSLVTKQQIATSERTGEILKNIGTLEMDAFLRAIDAWWVATSPKDTGVIIPSASNTNAGNTNSDATANTNSSTGAERYTNGETNTNTPVRTLPKITE